MKFTYQDLLHFGTGSLLLFFVFLPALAFGQVSPPSVKFDFEKQIGIAQANERNGLCINVDYEHTAGTKVIVVWAYGKQSVTEAVVEESLSNGCSLHADELRFSYRLKRTAGAVPDLANGISVSGSEGVPKLLGDTVEMDIDGDGKAERFRICTSMEGLHLTVWTGKPLKGKRRWHQYLSLGYDVDPNCKEQDYAEP